MARRTTVLSRWRSRVSCKAVDGIYHCICPELLLLVVLGSGIPRIDWLRSCCMQD